MATFAYLLRRLVAIGLGLALTGYSAWASWTYQGDLIGPLAAIAAAVLLALCEYAWRDRSYLHFALLGLLGLAAAAISASIVLERVAHTHAARIQAVGSANLPKVEAQKALDTATTALAAAEAATTANCGSGRGPGCKALEKREEAARTRVAEARSKLVGLGATADVDPAATLLGTYAGTIRLTSLLGLPLWLEMAAPVVLAYGFAPGRRKAPPVPSRKAVRRRKKRAPRKPAGAKLAAELHKPRLKLVAANDR